MHRHRQTANNDKISRFESAADLVTKITTVRLLQSLLHWHPANFAVEQLQENRIVAIIEKTSFIRL
jgi:hypothetical protein